MIQLARICPAGFCGKMEPCELRPRDNLRTRSRAPNKTPSLTHTTFVTAAMDLGPSVAKAVLHLIFSFLPSHIRRYFQLAYFILIVDVGKKGANSFDHGDLPRQHAFEITLRFTGHVPADSRQ